MRLSVIFQTEKLPIIYRHRIIALIKEALRISNVDYFQRFYSIPIGRPFTFWLRLPIEREIRKESVQIDKRFTVKEDVFYFKENSKLILVISSHDFSFFGNLHNGLLKLKEFPFSSQNEMLINNEQIVLKIEKTAGFPEKKVYSREAYFETRTPIVVSTKRDFITFSDDGFEEALNYVVNKRLSSPLVAGRGLKEPLKFEPVKMHKKVVKHTFKNFRNKTGKPIMFINASVGIFKLIGHPDDLSLLYRVGLGSRCSQGFGMIEVLI